MEEQLLKGTVLEQSEWIKVDNDPVFHLCTQDPCSEEEAEFSKVFTLCTTTNYTDLDGKTIGVD